MSYSTSKVTDTVFELPVEFEPVSEVQYDVLYALVGSKIYRITLRTSSVPHTNTTLTTGLPPLPVTLTLPLLPAVYVVQVRASISSVPSAKPVPDETSQAGVPLAPTLVKSESRGYFDTASVLLPTNGKVTCSHKVIERGRVREKPYGGGEEVAVGGDGRLAGGVEDADVLHEGLIFLVAGQPQAKSASLCQQDATSKSCGMLTLHGCQGHCRQCSLAPGL